MDLEVVAELRTAERVLHDALRRMEHEGVVTSERQLDGGALTLEPGSAPGATFVVRLPVG